MHHVLPTVGLLMTPPKLHLRDLFWLIVVMAIGLAWWMDRRQPVTNPAPQVGRWQLVISNKGEQIMVDTETGTAWDYNPPNGRWFKRSIPGK